MASAFCAASAFDSMFVDELGFESGLEELARMVLFIGPG